MPAGGDIFVYVVFGATILFPWIAIPFWIVLCLVWRLTNSNIDLPNIDLNGKVIVVTGGNAGIGKQTSLHLAKRGAHVIIASRSKQRTEEAIEDIRKQTAHGKLEWMECDLSSLESVLNFTRKYRARKIPLHVLVNNAGLMGLVGSWMNDKVTADGQFDLQFISNYLGHFLLTMELLDILKESKARIINVSSFTHWFVQGLDFKNLQGFGYQVFYNYARTKLMQILFTKELHKRYHQEGISSFALHPATVASSIVSEKGGNLFNKVQLYLVGTLWDRTPERVAKGPAFLAMQPELEKLSGEYFHRWLHVRSSPLSHDSMLASQLWEESHKILDKHVPNRTQISK